MRKNWRELYAQKYAKHNIPRYLKVGRIHEDIDDTPQIWRMKTQTETSSVDNAREVSCSYMTPFASSSSPCTQHGRVTTTDATPTSPHRASPPTVAYTGACNAQPTSFWSWEGDIWGGNNNTGKAVEVSSSGYHSPLGLTKCGVHRWVTTTSRTPSVLSLQIL